MSGTVWVKGDASQSAGATAHGGLLVVEGNAAARCGISMKGVDIVVGGNVGHMSAFMAQAGRLVIRGDAGEALGDSIYEARIYIRGEVASLGADCVAKEMRREHHQELEHLLEGRRFRRRRHQRLHPVRLGALAVPLPRRQRRELLMSHTTDDRARLGPARVRHLRPARRSPRSSGPPRPASTTSAAGAPNGRFRISTTCCSSARRCRATRWRATGNAATPTSCWAIGTPNTLCTWIFPVTIAGMSFGALSGPAKEALGRGASEVGTSTTTGDGGMTPEERGQSKYLVYQYLPSRYGMNPDDLRKADAIEVVLGQGAKPGGGGMLLGQKISERVAGMRTLPEGIDQRSACRHPDWTGPDDLTIKINELREITDWEKPIYVKVGATRTYYDVKLAVHAGADVVVVDGMQGGTAATQEVFIEHVGIPTLAAVPAGRAGAAGTRCAPGGAATERGCS